MTAPPRRSPTASANRRTTHQPERENIISTNTYRLAVTLQTKAIDSIDLHTRGAYTVAHTVGDYITVIARYRTGAGQRILQMWAHDADAHLLGSAEANRPVGGGLIASHVTAFRCQHLRWERASSPPPRSTATPPSSPSVLIPARPRSDSMPAAAPITTSLTTGRPGRSPHGPTWSLLVGTARKGLVLARTKVDADTAISYTADLETRHLAAI